MYFLDMISDPEVFNDNLLLIKWTFIVVIFVALLCLTIIAVRKNNNPGNAESGESSSGKGGSGTMLKVMIVLDCLFFVFLALILWGWYGYLWLSVTDMFNLTPDTYYRDEGCIRAQGKR